MAADKATLIASLQAVFENTANTPATAASGIADAIDTYAKTLTVAAGVPVATPDTLTGATTAPGAIS